MSLPSLSALSPPGSMAASTLAQMTTKVMGSSSAISQSAQNVSPMQSPTTGTTAASPAVSPGTVTKSSPPNSPGNFADSNSAHLSNMINLPTSSPASSDSIHSSGTRTETNTGTISFQIPSQNSSTAPSTASGGGTPGIISGSSTHNSSKSWVLAIALAIPAFLIFTGLALVTLRIRRQRRHRRKNVRISHSVASSSEGLGNTLRDDRQWHSSSLEPEYRTITSITPFDVYENEKSSAASALSQSQGEIPETEGRALANTDTRTIWSWSAVRRAIKPANTNALPSIPEHHEVPPTQVTLPHTSTAGNSGPDIDSDTHRPLNTISSPALINGEVAGTGSGPLEQMSEQLEALRERLRMVENIALSSVHDTRRGDTVSNIERELEELIPPPKYTRA